MMTAIFDVILSSIVIGVVLGCFRVLKEVEKDSWDTINEAYGIKKK